MESLYTAFVITGFIALILFIALAIYLLATIGKFLKSFNDISMSFNQLAVDMSKSLKSVTEDVRELKVKLIDSLENVNNASESIIRTTNKLENGVDNAIKVFNPLQDLVSIVYEKIAPPILTAAKIISAGSKALSVFSGFFMKDK